MAELKQEFELYRELESDDGINYVPSGKLFAINKGYTDYCNEGLSYIDLVYLSSSSPITIISDSIKEDVIFFQVKQVDGTWSDYYDTQEAIIPPTINENSSNVRIFLNKNIIPFIDFPKSNNLLKYVNNIPKIIVENQNLPFQNYKTLTHLNLSNLDLSNITTLSQFCLGCDKLEELNLSGQDFSNITNYDRFMDVSYPKIVDLSNVKFGSRFLNFNSNVTDLNLTNIDTTNVTDFHEAFAKYQFLERLNVNALNTANAENMSYMFSECKLIKNLNLNNFNTTKVTDMSYMFNECNSLTSLDLKNFKTSKVSNMDFMFFNCKNMEYLNVKDFNTTNVTSMRQIFCNCNSIISLDLSSWNIDNVTSMISAFENCYNLQSLIVTNFNMENLDGYSAQNLFYGCNSLTYIKCNKAFKDWCIANQGYIKLPTAMREGGSGTWQIVG